jgi:hypothetical protein
MAATEISAKKKSEFVQIRITRIKSKKSINITGSLVNHKRIFKGCDIFENQKAQLMWNKKFQMNEFFGKLYRLF